MSGSMRASGMATRRLDRRRVRWSSDSLQITRRPLAPSVRRTSVAAARSGQRKRPSTAKSLIFIAQNGPTDCLQKLLVADGSAPGDAIQGGLNIGVGRGRSATGRGLALTPCKPVEGLSSVMSDGQHSDMVVPDPVDYAVMPAAGRQNELGSDVSANHAA